MRYIFCSFHSTSLRDFWPVFPRRGPDKKDKWTFEIYTPEIISLVLIFFVYSASQIIACVLGR